MERLPLAVLGNRCSVLVVGLHPCKKITPRLETAMEAVKLRSVAV
jgi:hypothetical protein